VEGVVFQAVGCHSCGKETEPIAETTLHVFDSKDEAQEIGIRIYAPVRQPDGKWNVLINCSGLEYGTGWYSRPDSFECLCFAVCTLRRLLKQQLSQGYRVNQWNDIADYIDQLFHSWDD